MSRNINDCRDPGIDTRVFAVALALNDPTLEVLGYPPRETSLPSRRQPTFTPLSMRRIHPPKMATKLAAALPARYKADGLASHAGVGSVG